MHESGLTFAIDVGPDLESLENLYLVDPWRAQYRDAPPISLFFTEPRFLPAGTIVQAQANTPK